MDAVWVSPLLQRRFSGFRQPVATQRELTGQQADSAGVKLQPRLIADADADEASVTSIQSRG